MWANIHSRWALKVFTVWECWHRVPSVGVAVRQPWHRDNAFSSTLLAFDGWIRKRMKGPNGRQGLNLCRRGGEGWGGGCYGRQLIHHLRFGLWLFGGGSLAHIPYAVVWLPASPDPVSVKMRHGASSADNGGSSTSRRKSGVSVWSEEARHLIILHPNPSRCLYLLPNPGVTPAGVKGRWYCGDFDFQTNSKRQPIKQQRLAAYLVVSDTSIWCWRRADRRLGTSDWRCCPRWPWHPWICWRSWRGLGREKANQDWSFQLN